LKIAVLKDADAKQGDNSEARVSATPDTVKGYVASGHDVAVVKGAGAAANFSDADYKAAGASIATTNATAAKTADLVMSITGRDAKFVAGLKKGAGLTGLMNPTDNPKYASACAKAGVTAFALEYIPRIFSRPNQIFQVIAQWSKVQAFMAALCQ